MNILIISQLELISQTGVKTYYVTLRDEFTKTGHFVTIVTPKSAPITIKFILKVFRKLSLTLFHSDYNKLFNVESFYFISIFFAVRRVKKKKTWDIIHAQEPSSSCAAKFAVKSKIPVVTTCHYNDDPISERRLMYELTEHQLVKVEKWFRWLFRNNHNYIFVSNYVYEKSKHLLAETHCKRFIPHGVLFPELIPQKIHSEPFIVSNVGTLEERKNQILLINAAEYLKQQNFNFKIWFLGKGPKKSEWEKAVEEKGLSRYVIFWGFQKERLEIISKSHLYVHTAINDNSPLSISEAFSIGLPVLALNTGGISEKFPSTKVGLLPADISPQRLAEILIAFSNEELRENLKVEQFDNAKKFDIRSMAEQTISFYTTLINNNSLKVN